MMNGIYYLPQDFCDVLSEMFASCMITGGGTQNAEVTYNYPGAYELVKEDSKAYGFDFDIQIAPIGMFIKVSGIVNRVRHYGKSNYVMLCMQLPFGNLLGNVIVFIHPSDEVSMYLRFE